MNKIFRNLIFGRENILSGMVAFGVVAMIALGCTCGGKDVDLSNLGKDNSNSSHTSSNSPFPSSSDDGDIPSKPQLQSMLKTTAADFATAIDTEDFSTFYNNSSKDFQTTFTLQETKDNFKTYIDKKSTVLPILKRMQTTDADFSSEPHLRTEQGASILVMEGKFPTKPFAVKFDAEYIQRGGEWKLLVWKLFVG